MKKRSIVAMVATGVLALMQISCGGDDDGGGGNADVTVTAPVGGGAAPVLIWGNATGTRTSTYTSLFDHFAANGYLVVASNDTSTGDGDSLITALDWIEAENRRSGSPYYGKADLSRVAVSGHSQGGASAVVVAGRDSRIGALAAIMPDCAFWVNCDNAGDIRGTSLLIAGGSDSLVSTRTVRGVYDDIRRSPVVYAEIDGMGHTGWFGDQVDDVGKQILAFFDGVFGDSGKLSQFSGSNCSVCGRDWDLESKNF